MKDITSPRQLLDFMIDNINYGWIGIDGSKHIENLKDFRLLYYTKSLDETLDSKLATCIESAVVAKSWFDENNIECKLFCHRQFETEENLDKDVIMHIIILYKDEDKWIHFEHSNRPKRGIYEYISIDEALDQITSLFKERGETRLITEINDIPSGLSFKEFNTYVNSFDNNRKLL